MSFEIGEISFDLSVVQEYSHWIYALGIFLIVSGLRKPISVYTMKIMLGLTAKTKTDFDRKMVKSFEGPFRFLLGFLGIYIALRLLNLPENINVVILRIFRSIFIIAIARGFMNLFNKTSGILENLAKRFSVEVNDILIQFIAKGIRVIIIALTISIVVQEWGYNVNSFVAGLGIGGLAFALAAQDTLANLFGGMVITLDKPFTLEDWIETPSVEGVVEEITFRSTRVRTFAQALVHVPNATIVKEPITNWSRMGKRRIMFTLGVMYSTPRGKLEGCTRLIEELLINHEEIDNEFIVVRFNEFNNSSLDIFIYCFALTTQWGEFLRIQEDINFKTMDILEKEGVSVAIPSRSIYFENQIQKEVSGSKCTGKKEKENGDGMDEDVVGGRGQA